MTPLLAWLKCTPPGAGDNAADLWAQFGWVPTSLWVLELGVEPTGAVRITGLTPAAAVAREVTVGAVAIGPENRRHDAERCPFASKSAQPC